tara:strand:+ start:947 stop:1183 length:237 start_codon:yes stop_codon:yes gene_type:complete
LFKVGDIVGLRFCTDFKGVLIELLDHAYDELQENEMKRWKVLWFKHPYEDSDSQTGLLGRTTSVETYNERLLFKHDTD